MAGVASTMPPSAAFFLAAYSWILVTKRDCKRMHGERDKKGQQKGTWMGSAWAAAAMAGVLVLRQRLNYMNPESS